MGFHLAEGPVTNYEQIKGVGSTRCARFYRGCLKRGVFLPASPFEASFISASHTDQDVETAIAAMDQALAEAVS